MAPGTVSSPHLATPAHTVVAGSAPPHGRPGVFAVGDVRGGAIRRTASAVGEGSLAVRLCHMYLAESRGG